MNTLDTIADAIRRKDAEQRRAEVLEWRWMADSERSKWRELALVAALHFSRKDVADSTGDERVYTLPNAKVYHRSIDCAALNQHGEWKKRGSLVELLERRASSDDYYWGRRRPCAVCGHLEPQRRVAA